MKKAILYLRFTTVEQATKNDHAQKEYDFAQKYCSENGIEIVRVFDEISTKPPRERYYFDKALNVAKHAKEHGEELTYFLVMDYTRISRNFEEFIDIQNELKSIQIHIHPVRNGRYLYLEQFFNELNSRV